MPNYRRAIEPGGTFFFTLVTFNRQPFLCETPARRLLRDVIEACAARWPFDMEAIVLLPDHLHFMWTLPDGDSAYSRRIGWLKKEFTQRWIVAGGSEGEVSEGKRNDGRRGVWQPKFYEHTIRDEDDFEQHMNYVHYNPVKHGLVQCPHQWPYSSFPKWVKRGVYEWDWQCCCRGSRPTLPSFGGLRLGEME